MRVVRDLEDRRPDFVVLTGNGKREFDILKAVAKKYGCSRVLWFPKTPLAYLKGKIESGKLTAQSVYRAIKAYVNLEHYDFLVLYDREHFKGIEYDLKFLSNLNIKIIKCKSLIEDRAWNIIGSLGSHRIRILLSVQGTSKNFERGVGLPHRVEVRRVYRARGQDHQEVSQK